jgi:small subunit ribosomal protein S2
MAEAPPPTELPAAGAAPTETPEAPAAPPEPILATLGVRSLLEAGAHFGHQTHRWNPKMRPFIFGERHGVHIVDLDQTIVRLRAALDFLREITAGGGKVLFVGTKRQAQAPIKSESVRGGQFYVNNRWLGGMLTNFRTVRKSLDRYKELLELFADEEQVGELSKKERSRKSREIERYRKGLEGLLEMTRLPEALFVVDVGREHIAINEARRLGIPIVAVVDTNCDPEGIEHVIPANDDATRAILLYCGAAAEACLEGDQLHEERVRSQVQEEMTEVGRAAPEAIQRQWRLPHRRARPPQPSPPRANRRRLPSAPADGDGAGETTDPATS